MRMYHIISVNRTGGRGQYLDPVVAGNREEAIRLFAAAHKNRTIVTCRRAWIGRHINGNKKR